MRLRAVVCIPAPRTFLSAVRRAQRRQERCHHGRQTQSRGSIPGVADLILLKSNRDHGALLIEMKTPKGRQSRSQKKWQLALCSEDEYKYVVCRSLDDFIREVSDYLKNDND